eukprot:11220130-Lingulodinium_polyedra.AAC.1
MGAERCLVLALVAAGLSGQHGSERGQRPSGCDSSRKDPIGTTQEKISHWGSTRSFRTPKGPFGTSEDPMVRQKIPRGH